MSDYKVRHDAWPVLTAIAEAGGNVYNIEPGKDGWHSRASLAAWLAPHLKLPAEIVEASFANIDKPGSYVFPTREVTPRPDTGTTTRPATMTVQAAYDSGRITAQSRPDWERRYAADPQSVGEVLATLAPVLAAEYRATPKTAAEELDELDDAIFGVGHSEMSWQRHRARQDEQALAEHRAIEQAEREAEGQTISPDEWRQIYGTEPPEGL
jgi:hypothetical protein